MKEVFISHSSQNSDIAHAVAKAIENIGIETWIAPESIPSGLSYASAIHQGISDCSIFLIIYSEQCNNSDDVKNEIDLAHRNHKKIIPFCIDNSKMSGELQYYLSRKQQIHAYPNPEEKIQELLNQIVPALGYSWADEEEDDNSDEDTQQDDDDFDLAMEYDEAGEEEKAYPIFYKLARKGHSGAQAELGSYYEFGAGGLKQNFDKAFEWYQKAAEQEDIEGIDSLANFYCDCSSDKYKDEKKGIELFQKLIDLNAYQGYIGIAECYERGIGFDVNFQKAYDYYQKGLELTDNDEDKASVYANIGELFHNCEQYEDALDSFLKAIDLGYTNAHVYYRVGCYYQDGDGVRRDNNKAFPYFVNAYNNGSLLVAGRLGDCYLWGFGVEKDVNTAVEYYKEGIENNDPEAYIGLADIYSSFQTNIAYEKDDNKAFDLYNKAAKMNDYYAMYHLLDYYDKGEILEDRNEFKRLAQKILDECDDPETIEMTEISVSGSDFKFKIDNGKIL